MSTPVSTVSPAATMVAQPALPTQHLTQSPTTSAQPRTLSRSPLRRAWTTLTLELGKLRRKRYWLIAASATAVAEAGNYEVRPEGLYVLPQAADIQAGDKLWVSYSWGDQAVIEALTTKAVELELSFGGLNEADGGKPCVVDVWRVSQSITKQLALINDKFGALEVSGSVLQDMRRSGSGISRYYRQTIA